MNLDDYLKSNSPSALAAALGVSSAQLYQWRAGLRTVSPKRAVAIERATGGAVTRKDLRADWREIWIELEDS